jgi:hypothetical protein
MDQRPARHEDPDREWRQSLLIGGFRLPPRWFVADLPVLVKAGIAE